jgi:hypothetical protein
MIGDMGQDATRTAVVGTERTDEPFPFTTYVALASARDHLGAVTVRARHLPYGVWWDRLRPTVELTRPTADPVHDDEVDGDDGGLAQAQLLPLDGLWDDDGRFVAPDDAGYTSAAAAYRTGNGLF